MKASPQDFLRSIIEGASNVLQRLEAAEQAGVQIPEALPDCLADIDAEIWAVWYNVLV